MLRSFLVVALVLGSTLGSRAEEIPLDSCDGLPVVAATLGGMKFLLLVDTAATSMLNSKSFPHGEARSLSVTSWNETIKTDAQEVLIGDLAIGQHHFRNLKLPAIDLSAIGRACGRRLDGVLGIDLLSKLGATVDLKQNASRLLFENESTESRVRELQEEFVACQEAFNRADEKVFSECLDPNIVLFAMGGDFYGRDAAMAYYRERYFRHPPVQLSIVPRAHHPLGEAIWVEYDLRIVVSDQVVIARGTALCQKNNGRWRNLHMNHSIPMEEAPLSQDSLASPAAVIDRSRKSTSAIGTVPK